MHSAVDGCLQISLMLGFNHPNIVSCCLFGTLHVATRGNFWRLVLCMRKTNKHIQIVCIATCSVWDAASCVCSRASKADLHNVR
jgi:hypothetical protein